MNEYPIPRDKKKLQTTQDIPINNQYHTKISTKETGGEGKERERERENNQQTRRNRCP